MKMIDKKLNNRLSRMEGQLHKLHESINEGQDCSDVIPQFLAVKGALAGAYEEYVKQSMDSCGKSDKKKLESLVSLLIRS